MIRMPLPHVPVPDAVARLTARCLPDHVARAYADALAAAADVRLYRSEIHQEDREDALAQLARANKILAAYNPGLIVRGGAA